MRPAAERRTGRRTARAASLGCLAAVALVLILGGLALPARAAPPGVTGEINGPKDLGTHLKGTYTVTATGGPAEAANATQIGFYAFNATIAGRNTTGGFVSPSTGVLTNGSATLVVHAPNATQSLTLYVLVTSGYHGHNESNNLTYAIQVVAPYNLNATLVVPAGATVGP
ncbi:MAG TPA: hypothetical protein VGS18_01540, partial [Thermoplasmata archaeon]|nr:hypothetical protein [Thermoplasmata archaeon]